MIREVVTPRIEALERQLNQISERGSTWGVSESERIDREIAAVRGDVKELREKVLTPDGVAQLISKALQQASARGWTTRERTMGVLVFLITVASFALNLLAIRGR